MSAEKADLARAGTMQVTAKEGKAYLDKNLTEWKKPYLLSNEEGGADGTSDSDVADVEEEKDSSPVKKPKLSKHTTMKGTAKEGKALVGDKLGDTRAETKSKSKKGNMNRATTIDKVTEEAKLIYGDLPKSEGRSMRKRAAAPSPAKGPLKKKGTMQKTAAEGKAFLKRGRPKKAAAEKKDAEADNSEEAKSDGDA